jgi:Uma2 family endonuclease
LARQGGFFYARHYHEIGMMSKSEHEEAGPMAMYVVDSDLERRLKAERQLTGADRLDEVWDGVYFMPPLPNNEHQFFQTQLAIVLQMALGSVDHGTAYAGVNVSDREKGWKKNYRCPDVAVVLPGCKAKNCGTHWFGGPDLVVEIISPKDRSREKLPFYSGVGVRELLLMDRHPWSLELFRLQGSRLESCGRSTIPRPIFLNSFVLPVNIRLVPPGARHASNGQRKSRSNGRKQVRPALEIVHKDGDQRWII